MCTGKERGSSEAPMYQSQASLFSKYAHTTATPVQELPAGSDSFEAGTIHGHGR